MFHYIENTCVQTHLELKTTCVACTCNIIISVFPWLSVTDSLTGNKNSLDYLSFWCQLELVPLLYYCLSYDEYSVIKLLTWIVQLQHNLYENPSFHVIMHTALLMGHCQSYSKPSTLNIIINGFFHCHKLLLYCCFFHISVKSCK